MSKDVRHKKIRRPWLPPEMKSLRNESLLSQRPCTLELLVYIDITSNFGPWPLAVPN